MNISLSNLLFYGLFALFQYFTWTQIDKLPDFKEIHPFTKKAPVQVMLPEDHPSFDIDYKGLKYEVKPLADYIISALVMSMNNPAGFGDIYHDETSLDTRDFCVVYGENLQSNVYKYIDSHNTSWTCWYKLVDKKDVFSHSALSNNHLITNKQSIRDKIASVKVGDQVTIKGKLVSYRMHESDFWRKSSLSRDDTGNKACESIFVEDLRILRKTNRWSKPVFWIGLVVLPLGRNRYKHWKQLRRNLPFYAKG